MVLNLEFDDCNPEDINKHDMKLALSAALGIPVTDVLDVSWTVDEDGKVKIEATLMETPRVRELLDNDDFDIYDSLARQPVASFLNLKPIQKGTTLVFSFLPL